MILLFLLAMLLVSCGGQGNALPTPDLNVILTAAVGTVAESIFQTQTALAPPATETPTITPSPISTNTPFAQPSLINSPTATLIFFSSIATPTRTITPTGTQYTPTANPSTLAYGCNNLLLLRDETIPAGTVFKPGESFMKTWKVSNNGTCNWVYLYRMVFAGGEQMGGEPPKLNKVIEPGKWTQLSVNFTAPKNPGTYTGYWRLGDGSGNAFGSTLGVSIVVSSPTNTPVPPTETPTETPTEVTPSVVAP
jgi:hypothetical protein